MLELDALRIFVKVAELGSFTRAAEQLGVTKARASLRVQALEGEVGARLLYRTTRAVRLTSEGERFLGRARALVDEADELGAMFHAPSLLRGRVRLDAPITIACELLLPRLPELVAAHPRIEVLLSATDRRVDVVRDGFDCVLRVGTLADSGLVVQRLGAMEMVNCASPGYLRERGIPRTLEDLDGHLVVNYSLTLDPDEASFEYRDGDGYRQRPMRSALTVNNTGAYESACLAGLGIIQAPRHGMQPWLDSGRLVSVLPEHTCEPLPVSLVHAHAGRVPERVRAVMKWIAAVLAPHLARPR